MKTLSAFLLCSLFLTQFGCGRPDTIYLFKVTGDLATDTKEYDAYSGEAELCFKFSLVGLQGNDNETSTECKEVIVEDGGFVTIARSDERIDTSEFSKVLSFYLQIPGKNILSGTMTKYENVQKKTSSNEEKNKLLSDLQQYDFDGELSDVDSNDEIQFIDTAFEFTL